MDSKIKFWGTNELYIGNNTKLTWYDPGPSEDLYRLEISFTGKNLNCLKMIDFKNVERSITGGFKLSGGPDGGWIITKEEDTFERTVLELNDFNRFTLRDRGEVFRAIRSFFQERNKSS